MTRPLSRRTFLRGSALGAAVALALPPLEAMFTDKDARADVGAEPFFGLFYWANGLPWHGKHGAVQAGPPDLWTPQKTGPGYTPSELLSPLARHNVTVATGFTPHTEVPASPPGQEDGHMRGFMVAMTGDRIRPQGFDQPSHTLTALRPTLDQVIARHPSFYDAARPPRFRSLELGISMARFHDFGHWAAVSYNGPDSLNPPLSSPAALYDRLFALPTDTAELSRRDRALDAVLADAKRLRQGLGAADQARLDAHLEHLYAIQQRLRFSSAACKPPGRPGDGGDLLQKTTAMAEVLAVAVGCGLTRVFSFMLTSPATTHVFSNLGVADDMHKTCHDGRWEEIRRVTNYQMQAFALLLDAFAKVPLPMGGTLLDRGVIYGTSEYGEGWKHSVAELPIVIAGRAGGKLRPGVHVREEGGNLCKAQLTTLRALGLPFDRFGWNGAETTELLPGVLV